MLEEIILKQKSERQLYVTDDYVVREKLSAALTILDKSITKVIVGPRRSGKSVFCFQLLRGKNFAYVNFDDDQLEKTENHDRIIEAVEAVYPQAQYYFFDEVQNLPKWELLVAKLVRQGKNLVLTGSNANLLSTELATRLTGRYLTMEILPFSFGEWLAAKKQIGPNQVLLKEYLETGGYPEIVVKGLLGRDYLSTLFDAVIFNDIVRRYKVRYGEQLAGIGSFLTANFGASVSVTRVKNILQFSSTHTVQKYLSYFGQTYLFFFLSRFAKNMGEKWRSPRKIYMADTGLSAVNSMTMSPNWGKLAENAVFLHLVRQGYVPNKTLFSYQTKNGKEVDFILREGIKTVKLVQVCWEVADAKTEKRELAALSEAQKELGCKETVVVTMENLAENLLNGGY